MKAALVRELPDAAAGDGRQKLQPGADGALEGWAGQAGGRGGGTSSAPTLTS